MTVQPEGEPEMVPARIHLQIREGALNHLASFELETVMQEPRPDGTIEHVVSAGEIIGGIAEAMREKVNALRRATTNVESVNKWLEELSAWILSPTPDEEEAA